MPNVTTSIPLEIWKIAREKHLKWSECLIVGIKKLLNEPIVKSKDEKIVFESKLAKKEKQVRTMQDYILDLTSEIDKLRGKRKNVN